MVVPSRVSPSSDTPPTDTIVSMTTKTCSRCDATLDLKEFYKAKAWKDGFMSWCKRCHNNAVRLAYSSSKRKNFHLKYLYGITLEEYESKLKEQDNKCAICKSPEPGGKGNFYVDHNHTTKEVRALLCHWCNFMIGQSKESIEILQAGIEYLKKWGEPSQL